jgi:cytochrome c biogenesis protein CcmG/thiol:disulfide interchange protein DsbE
MRRITLVVAAVGLLVGLFLFGLLRGAPDRAVASALTGQLTPDFTLPLFERYHAQFGETLTLSDYRGRVPIVLNFWATWCLPCFEEAPHLEAAWRKYQDEVLVIGVQTQDRGKHEEGRQFIRQFDLTFPNVIDDRSAVSINYALFGVPETFFIRADGTLAHKHVGTLTPEILDTHIGALLQ